MTRAEGGYRPLDAAALALQLAQLQTDLRQLITLIEEQLEDWDDASAFAYALTWSAGATVSCFQRYAQIASAQIRPPAQLDLAGMHDLDPRELLADIRDLLEDWDRYFERVRNHYREQTDDPGLQITDQMLAELTWPSGA